MKIEAGKFYKTRGGLKVRIYATDGWGTDGRLHGATLLKEGWYVHAWCADGNFYTSKIESSIDIVSEWEEPKPRMLAWVNKTFGNIVLAPEGKETEVFNTRASQGAALQEEYTRIPHLDEPEMKLGEGKKI